MKGKQEGRIKGRQAGRQGTCRYKGTKEEREEEKGDRRTN